MVELVDAVEPGLEVEVELVEVGSVLELVETGEDVVDVGGTFTLDVVRGVVVLPVDV